MARTDPTPVTTAALRDWPLPAAEGSKYSRGQVVVIGGARSAPGAAMLAGVSALRVGGGRLTLAVAASVAPHVAVAIPESAVFGLPETADGHVTSIDDVATELERADAVLVGPGLDSPEETARMLERLPELVSADATIVLDAFALGVLPGLPDLGFGGRLILTPNVQEAGRLLGRDIDDLDADTAAIAKKFGAAVTCFGAISDPDGQRWTVGAGSPGLATSGSGDALAGAIVGLAARGASPAQAAVWGTHLHAMAGDRLAASVGPIGYLAGEIPPQLPHLLNEIGQ